MIKQLTLLYHQTDDRTANLEKVLFSREYPKESALDLLFEMIRSSLIAHRQFIDITIEYLEKYRTEYHYGMINCFPEKAHIGL